MELQEIFDKVRTHLLAQGERSLLRQGDRLSCAYRGSDGAMCALGCLISDDQYTPDIEGGTLYAQIVRDALTASGVPCSLLDDIHQLQRIHDQKEPEDWGEALRLYANHNGLVCADDDPAV